MKPLSPQLRLKLAAVLPVLLTVILFSYCYTYGAFRSAKEQRLHDSQLYLQELLPAFQFELTHHTTNTLRELIEIAESNPEVQALSVYNPAGKALFYHGTPIQFPRTLSHATTTHTIQSKGSTLFAPIFEPSTSVNTSMQPLAPHLLGWLAIKIDTHPAQLIFYQHLLFGCCLSLLCLLGGWSIHTALTRHLRLSLGRLKRSMKQILRNEFETEIRSHPRSPISEIEQGAQYLQRHYLDSIHDLNHQIEVATADLQQSLELLEEKNIELSMERRKTEDKIHQQSEFIANMSHEIRTPMNGILGFTNVLLETTLSALQKEYIHTIKSSAYDLLNIINDILDYSKIDAGKLHLEAIPIDIRHMIDEVLMREAPTARQKHLDLIALTQPTVPKIAVGDPLRLKQILNNLITNAVKFTEKGHVLIQTTVDKQTAQHYDLLFKIIDTGIGIPLDEQPYLFTAFQQADVTISRRFGGSGLGLVICKKLAETMNGQISIESKPNEGTTFSIRIRLKKLPTYELEKTATHDDPKQTILCIDPNPLSREALNHTLCFLNHTPIFLNNLQELPTDLPEPPLCLIMHLPASSTLDTLPPLSMPCIVIAPTPLPNCIHLLPPVSTQKLEDALQTLRAPVTPINTYPTPSLRQTIKNHQLSILIAEDNAINRQLLETMLSPLCKVHMVPDGLAAIQTCKTTTYDLLLVDLQMPKRSGQAVATYLREHLPTYQHTPILFISANANDIDPSMLKQLKIHACLQKPFDETTLLQAIIQALHTTNAASIDWERCLKNLSGNLDLAKTCLTQFIDEIPQNRTQLTQFLTQKNHQGIADAAHTLKGACGFLAITKLKQIAHDIEINALHATSDMLAERVQQLFDEMTVVESTARGLLETPVYS